MQAVAGDDKELFALGSAIEQAEEPGLRVRLIIAGADITKGLIKCIKQENSFLVDGLDVVGDTGNELVNNNDRVSGSNRLHTQTAGKKGFPNALVAAQDDAHVPLE